MSAVEYRDGFGRSWWQPRLESGERLYDRWSFDDVHRVWRSHGYVSYGAGMEPVMFRSKARAERVARREDRRRLACKLARVTEVGDE
ncbi:Hypotetical protein [Gulosibacter molinativorax]|nr:Hypotetical protein [Gulosibacter molinativorax]